MIYEFISLFLSVLLAYLIGLLTGMVDVIYTYKPKLKDLRTFIVEKELAADFFSYEKEKNFVNGRND